MSEEVSDGGAARSPANVGAAAARVACLLPADQRLAELDEARLVVDLEHVLGAHIALEVLALAIHAAHRHLAGGHDRQIEPPMARRIGDDVVRAWRYRVADPIVAGDDHRLERRELALRPIDEALIVRAPAGDAREPDRKAIAARVVSLFQRPAPPQRPRVPLLQPRAD